ncbi:hypothetical protein NDU88_004508 [Pleurodeles waltl]|uniref:Uncharacterized protein n=1 Tax=Pleurodeles waltl TaxID=8319 RepID=A0AAV7RLI7_PLEWA|nr:hypothetical protein NDU88_004508 [Pleurodeles waltl]
MVRATTGLDRTASNNRGWSWRLEAEGWGWGEARGEHQQPATKPGLRTGARAGVGQGAAKCPGAAQHRTSMPRTGAGTGDCPAPQAGHSKNWPTPTSKTPAETTKPRSGTPPRRDLRREPPGTGVSRRQQGVYSAP